jgi:hypothetical protein
MAADEALYIKNTKKRYFSQRRETRQQKQNKKSFPVRYLEEKATIKTDIQNLGKGCTVQYCISLE